MHSQITRVRAKVFCFCKKCNGLLLVDPRTKKKHMSKSVSYMENNFESDNNNENMEDNFESDNNNENMKDNFESDNDEMEHDPPPEIIEPIFLTKKIGIHKSGNFQKG